MMSKQPYTPQSTTPRGVSVRVAPGQALRLGSGGGEFVVLQGRVWFTRGTGAGDTGDHRVEEGQRIQVTSGQDAVIEPWDSVTPVQVYWQPLPHGVAADVSAFALRTVAFLAAQAAGVLRGLAGGLAGVARGATAGARRAQGCVGDAA
jgi:hypothetical protein